MKIETPEPPPRAAEIIPDLSSEEYHSSRAHLTSTQLRALSRSWADYLIARDRDVEPTSAMRVGTAAHALILEGVDPCTGPVVPPGAIRTKRDALDALRSARDAGVDVPPWSGLRTDAVIDLVRQCCPDAVIAEDVEAEWRAAHPDAVILTDDEAETVLRTADAAAENSAAQGVLRGAAVEQTVRWTEHVTCPCGCGEEVEIPAQARPDAIAANGWLVDLKTTSRDVDPDSVRWQARRSGWMVQSAWYARGLRAAGQDPEGCVYIVAGTTPPHLCEVYCLWTADDDLPRVIANDEIEQALRRYARHTTHEDGWGGYSGDDSPGITPLDVPGYS